MQLTHGSLFSGIGGFDLAAERAGIKNIFQVEVDEFCQQVLSKNFPDTEKYKDIYEFDAKKYRGRIDIISGGFPCQPFSQAGKRKGREDERILFPEMLRVIREIEPTWVLAENVYGILTIHNGEYFEEVCSQMEGIGYEVLPIIIPASSINAPHRRYRVWIIAHARRRDGKGETNENQFTEPIGSGNAIKLERSIGRNKLRTIADTDSWRNKRHERKSFEERAITRSSSKWTEKWIEVAARICRVDDGLSRGMDRRKRLKSLGNSIVPQVAELLFRIIKQEKT
jgi:DNA (cytosine-5)-methyltransferase 1